jgi:hypothetical protein
LYEVRAVGRQESPACLRNNPKSPSYPIVFLDLFFQNEEKPRLLHYDDAHGILLKK